MVEVEEDLASAVVDVDVVLLLTLSCEVPSPEKIFFKMYRVSLKDPVFDNLTLLTYFILE